MLLKGVDVLQLLHPCSDLYQKRYFLITLPGEPKLRRRGEYLICHTTDGARSGARADCQSNVENFLETSLTTEPSGTPEGANDIDWQLPPYLDPSPSLVEAFRRRDCVPAVFFWVVQLVAEKAPAEQWRHSYHDLPKKGDCAFPASNVIITD
jgi:hypothetical protein